MTRGEQLRWWREGYAAGLAAGARQRQEAGEAEHAIAVAEFREQRRADRQAVTDALVLELIDVLARAMLDDGRKTHRPTGTLANDSMVAAGCRVQRSMSYPAATVTSERRPVTRNALVLCSPRPLMAD